VDRVRGGPSPALRRTDRLACRRWLVTQSWRRPTRSAPGPGSGPALRGARSDHAGFLSCMSTNGTVRIIIPLPIESGTVMIGISASPNCIYVTDGMDFGNQYY
jgi:hypothetical protein